MPEADPSPLDDIRRQLNELLDRNRIDPRAVALQVSVTSERERAALRRLRDQLRALPSGAAAPGDWLKLGDGLAAAGDFDGARWSHGLAADSARAAADQAAEAEAHFKSYRDACEQGRLGEALADLRLATALNPARFEPFPFRRYEPTALLGVGGFGAVFRCRDRYAGEEVAVKALHAADLERSLDEVFAEARALRLLRHPHVISLRDQAFADEEESRPYFVLEYFDGMSIDAYRRQNGVIPPADLAPLARMMASAVRAAHEASILHRDLKPANVLVRRDGEAWDVRVIDFGLAVRHSTAVRATVASADAQTRRERSFAGTLRYAAPEQRGELPGVKVGPYSDVYAFGKTCVELLLGHTEAQAEDWEDLPEPWRTRWQKLLTACVRLRLDGARPRVLSMAVVLAEMEAWDKAPLLPHQLQQTRQPESPPAPVATKPELPAQPKPGELLVLRIPPWIPAAPLVGPRFLTLRWQPAQ